jgi:hypothetical protein
MILAERCGVECEIIIVAKPQYRIEPLLLALFWAVRLYFRS